LILYEKTDSAETYCIRNIQLIETVFLFTVIELNEKLFFKSNFLVGGGREEAYNCLKI